jgi:hypothetical protein
MEYMNGYYDGHYNPERLADVWWCFGEGWAYVGNYTLNGKIAEIACCGEMRLIFEPLPDSEYKEIIRDVDELEPYASNDKEWYEFLKRKDVTVDMNCWLEVRLRGDDTEFPEVCENLAEALDYAHALLSE